MKKIFGLLSILLLALILVGCAESNPNTKNTVPDLTVIENKIKILEDKIKSLETEKTNLQKDINDLQEYNEQLEKDLIDLEKRVIANLEQEVRDSWYKFQLTPDYHRITLSAYFYESVIFNLSKSDKKELELYLAERNVPSELEDYLLHYTWTIGWYFSHGPGKVSE